MKFCAKVHGVDREVCIQNKWHCKCFKPVETLQNTIFRDFREFSANFGYFWHHYSAATGSNELKISPKLHQTVSYKTLKKNHSVILRALLYLKRFIFIRFWHPYAVTSKREKINPWKFTHSFSNLSFENVERIKLNDKWFLDLSRE